MVRARSRRVGRSGRRAQGDSRSDGTGLRRIHPLRAGRSAAEIWREREVPKTDNRRTPADAGLGYRPASIEQPLTTGLDAILISPKLAPPDAARFEERWSAPVALPQTGPRIITRAQWGANESDRCPPVYNRDVRAGVVHHTAGSNNYSPYDSAAIIRAIYAYHTKTLKWCDIAYNVLVDKYGQIFEAVSAASPTTCKGRTPADSTSTAGASH